MNKSIKQEIFNIIQIGDKSNVLSRVFDVFITLAILLNIIVTFMLTFDYFKNIYSFLHFIEYTTLFIFCVEYLARVWTSDYLYPNLSKGKACLSFLFSFYGIIDFLTIVPAFFLSGVVFFRMFRVARIFHLFRLNAQYDSFNIIGTVLMEKKNQIISSLFIVLILMFASSLCMYSVEHDAQPEVFENAFSGIWWSVSTLLTVGYGDIYPITVLGKIMAICISYLGVGVVAIPTGIISAGFVEQYQKKSNLTHVRELDIKSIAEIIADEKYIGKTISEIEQTYHFMIYLVLRKDLSVLPNKDMVIEENDILIVHEMNY